MFQRLQPFPWCLYHETDEQLALWYQHLSSAYRLEVKDAWIIRKTCCIPNRFSTTCPKQSKKVPLEGHVRSLLSRTSTQPVTTQATWDSWTKNRDDWPYVEEPERLWKAPRFESTEKRKKRFGADFYGRFWRSRRRLHVQQRKATHKMGCIWKICGKKRENKFTVESMTRYM